ncbi:hypothetical protein D3C74_332700 [compost metagenome]
MNKCTQIPGHDVEGLGQITNLILVTNCNRFTSQIPFRNATCGLSNCSDRQGDQSAYDERNECSNENGSDPNNSNPTKNLSNLKIGIHNASIHGVLLMFLHIIDNGFKLTDQSWSRILH